MKIGKAIIEKNIPNSKKLQNRNKALKSIEIIPIKKINSENFLPII